MRAWQQKLLYRRPSLKSENPRNFLGILTPSLSATPAFQDLYPS